MGGRWRFCAIAFWMGEPGHAHGSIRASQTRERGRGMPSFCEGNVRSRERQEPPKLLIGAGAWPACKRSKGMPCS